MPNISHKPRIGVLTFHNGPNFGGVLQAWHMVHAIRGLGYECHAVNYLHAYHHNGMQNNIKVRNLKSLRIRMYWHLRKRGFKGFSDSICRHPFTSNVNDVPWDDFDAFCVGSDVVWEYEKLGYGRDPVYFGEAPGLLSKPIMSYAASCGPANPEGTLPSYIESGLQRFAGIGVRDTATQCLVKNACGRDSQLVVDPTWLGPDPEPKWKHTSRKKYLFLYGGRVDPETTHKIMRYCHSRGLELVSGLTRFKEADKMYRSLTPFQWVNLFKYAEGVIVMGSLHGAAYAIKYGKPFMMIPSAGSFQKVSTLLDRTDNSYRITNMESITDQSFALLDDVHHPRPNIPDSWKKESLKFLGNTLATMTR